MAKQNGSLPEDEELRIVRQRNPQSPPKSQRIAFEQAWGDHEPNLHPDALKLHVERRARDAHVSDQTACLYNAALALLQSLKIMSAMK